MILREAVSGIILAVILTVVFMGLVQENCDKNHDRPYNHCQCPNHETCCHHQHGK